MSTLNTAINDVIGLQLAAAYTAGSGSMTLQSGQGARITSVPTLITVVTEATYLTGSGEVKASYVVSAVNGDVLTVAVTDGYSDRNFSIDDYVDCRPEAEYINQLNSAVDTLRGQFPVSVASGGTGNTSLTAHGVLLGEGTGNVAFATTGTGGRVLIDQGANTDPSFEAVTGDVSLASSGAATVEAIQGNAVASGAPTNGQLLIGGSSGWAVASLTAGSGITLTPGSGTLEIAATGGGSGITALTKDVLASGTGSVAALFSGQTAMIAPASLSAQTNNWSPTGWLSGGVQQANVIRFGATAYCDLTGLAAPTSGNIDGVIVTLELLASSAFPVRLVAGSGSSSAANQFLFSSNLFLAPGESLSLKYDNTAGGWRELTGHKDFLAGYFGSGQDGNVSLSSGTTTLTRDMYYQSLTLSGTASIVTAGYRIFVSEMLDISAAQAGAISWNGGAGGAGGATGTAGSAGTRTLGAYPNQLAPTAANTGAAGGTGAGTAGGNGSAAGAPTTNAAANGGAGGSATSGGTAGGGAGSGGGGASALQSIWGYQLTPYEYIASATWDSFWAAPPGGSGGSGGGDGTNKGGGGGGTGVSGGTVWLAARFINRGSSSTAAIIQSRGGAGGAGGTPTTGTPGGGGGGGGGNGGAIQLYYGYLLGSQITDALDVSSGAGGAGGSGVSTGAGGNGGGGGGGGKITAVDLVTGAVAETIGGSRTSGGAASGSTGGSAGTAVTTQQNL